MSAGRAGQDRGSECQLTQWCAPWSQARSLGPRRRPPTGCHPWAYALTSFRRFLGDFAVLFDRPLECLLGLLAFVGGDARAHAWLAAHAPELLDGADAPQGA